MDIFLRSETLMYGRAVPETKVLKSSVLSSEYKKYCPDLSSTGLADIKLLSTIVGEVSNLRRFEISATPILAKTVAPEGCNFAFISDCWALLT